MENKLTTARSQHAELITRRAKFDQKKRDCESMAAEKRMQLANLEAQHKATERDFICGKATIKQVQDLRKEVEKTITELAECERLAGLAAEAIEEIDQQIQQAKQQIAAARREFCVKQSNNVLNEIKTDVKLRARIIEAMAARAASGSGGYTFNVAYFAQHHFSAILPEISEAEVRAAVDQFTKSNELD